MSRESFEKDFFNNMKKNTGGPTAAEEKEFQDLEDMVAPMDEPVTKETTQSTNDFINKVISQIRIAAESAAKELEKQAEIIRKDAEKQIASLEELKLENHKVTDTFDDPKRIEMYQYIKDGEKCYTEDYSEAVKKTTKDASIVPGYGYKDDDGNVMKFYVYERPVMREKEKK